MDLAHITNSPNSKTIDLVDLFKHIKQAGRTARHLQIGFDGWQPLKKKFGCIDLKIDLNFGPFPDIIYSEGDEIGHENATVNIGNFIFSYKVKDDKSNEHEHFIVQHFRIVLMCENNIPLVKLLQIAYNIGQFEVEVLNGSYPAEVVKFYNENKMGKITTYIGSENVDVKIIF